MYQRYHGDTGQLKCESVGGPYHAIQQKNWFRTAEKFVPIFFFLSEEKESIKKGISTKLFWIQKQRIMMYQQTGSAGATRNRSAGAVKHWLEIVQSMLRKLETSLIFEFQREFTIRKQQRLKNQHTQKFYADLMLHQKWLKNCHIQPERNYDPPNKRVAAANLDGWLVLRISIRFRWHVSQLLKFHRETQRLSKATPHSARIWTKTR